MPPLSLSLALGPYPQVAAIHDGSLVPERLHFEPASFASISDAFKVMCRTTAFDVSEMSITGYLLGRVYGKPFTALPVFPVRGFPQSHAALVYNAGAGIESPRDLEGKTVGARAYTGTASLWVRGVLQREYGVDLDRVTWVCAEKEHVLEYQQDAPSNVVYDIGADLAARLSTGELAAGIGLGPAQPPTLLPMFLNARNDAADFYRRTGIYQINHTVVVRDELLQQHPWLAEALYEMFCAAKASWLSASPDVPVADQLSLPARDPLPYGLEANAASIDTLLDFAYQQKITPRRLTVLEAFPIAFD